MNPLDPRSKRGTLSRGNNVYKSGSRAPNPTGNNQFTKAQKLKKAAQSRMDMIRKQNGQTYG